MNLQNFCLSFACINHQCLKLLKNSTQMQNNFITKAIGMSDYLLCIWTTNCAHSTTRHAKSPLRNTWQQCYSIHVGKCMIFLFVFERIKLNSDNSFEIWSTKLMIIILSKGFIKCVIITIHRNFLSLSISTLFQSYKHNKHIGRTQVYPFFLYLLIKGSILGFS